MFPRAEENQWKKGRLATHLVVRCPLDLPHKSAQESNYHGNDKGGQGKDGDAVEVTCQGEENGLGLQHWSHGQEAAG